MVSHIKPVADNIQIFSSDIAWANYAINLIVAQAKEAIQERGLFSLVLSGGSTPRSIYSGLASKQKQSKLEWGKIFIFWGDERCVPPTHSESNYRLAKHNLLNHIPIPEENVFRMIGEQSPQEAAKNYANIINEFFIGREKKFDTILLGIGEDGHTASLFPGTNALEETERWVIGNLNPTTKSWRITLTFPAINSARNILFLAKGSKKSKIIADVIQNPEAPPRLPAKRITGKDKPPVWILDQLAAGDILINTR